MAARKSPARKASKTRASKKVRRRKVRAPSRALTAFEEDLPPKLGQFARRMRLGLVKLEKQVVHARADYAKRSARMLREVSHELGRLEAKGEKEWRRLSLQARRDAGRLLRRLEKAVEPPRKRRAKKAASPRPPVETRGSGI